MRNKNLRTNSAAPFLHAGAGLFTANLKPLYPASLDTFADYEPVYGLRPRQGSESSSVVNGLDYYGERLPAPIPGGNFLDFIPFNGDCLALAIGDCSGDDGSVTFARSGLRDVFRDLAPEDREDVSNVMKQANRTLYRLSAGDFYSAMFYAQLYPCLGQLQYINAGHEAPILVRGRSGRAHNLESNGTLLGLTDRPIFRRRSVPIEPGDVLIVFTDGVVESLNEEGRPFSRTDILRIVRRHPSATARELTGELISAVTRYGSAAPSQDRSVAVIKMKERTEKTAVEEAEEESVEELAFCAA